MGYRNGADGYGYEGIYIGSNSLSNTRFFHQKRPGSLKKIKLQKIQLTQTPGIIGSSGFIGGYITEIFLEENHKVKVSITDFGNKMKYEHLLTLTDSGNLEIITLDTRDKNTLRDLVKGCEIVIYGGTPFQLDVKDPQTDLFDPTVSGTCIFLEVTLKANDLKKVVFIASVMALNTAFPMHPATYDPDRIFTEQHTPYISDADHPYAQAKLLADQEVRKFIRENQDLPFEIISVSPAVAIGNSLCERTDSTSMGLQYLIKNKIAPNLFVEMLFATDTMFSMVDVRDVPEVV